MKFIPALIALTLCLTACSTAPSDAALRRGLVGTWSLENDSTKVIENRADGSYVMRRAGRETVKGTWKVRNGYAIGTVTNGPLPDGHSLVESNRVLSLRGNTLVILSIDGHTQLTCHRQSP